MNCLRKTKILILTFDRPILHMRSFISCTHPQILLGRANQDNEVRGTCGTHGIGEESVQDFGGKTRRKETTWKTKAWMGGWDQNGS
jgi:hypothetical protein